MISKKQKEPTKNMKKNINQNLVMEQVISLFAIEL